VLAAGHAGNVTARYRGDSSVSVKSRGAVLPPDSSLASVSHAASCTVAHELSAQPAPACDVSECSKPSGKNSARHPRPSWSRAARAGGDAMSDAAFTSATVAFLVSLIVLLALVIERA
jgi:hypothetical protein